MAAGAEDTMAGKKRVVFDDRKLKEKSGYLRRRGRTDKVQVLRYWLPRPAALWLARRALDARMTPGSPAEERSQNAIVLASVESAVTGVSRLPDFDDRPELMALLRFAEGYGWDVCGNRRDSPIVKNLRCGDDTYARVLDEVARRRSEGSEFATNDSFVVGCLYMRIRDEWERRDGVFSEETPVVPRWDDPRLL